MTPLKLSIAALTVLTASIVGNASKATPPVSNTIKVGPDVFVDIMDHQLPNGTISDGGSRASTIRIRRGDTQLIYDDIWDQPLTPADIAYVNAGGNDWNIAVRSGRDKDVLTCYAVRGNEVFCNLTKEGKGGRFRFGHHGDKLKDYGFTWENMNTLKVSFGDKTGVIFWDAEAKKWHANGEQVS
jgi:hypothetical protein